MRRLDKRLLSVPGQSLRLSLVLRYNTDPYFDTSQTLRSSSPNGLTPVFHYQKRQLGLARRNGDLAASRNNVWPPFNITQWLNRLILTIILLLWCREFLPDALADSNEDLGSVSKGLLSSDLYSHVEA